MFGVFAMFGAYGGAKLGVLLPANVQLSVLATVMIAAAVSMLRLNSSLDMETSYSPRHARLSWSASVAVAIGALTGLVGIGGGFLFVPALVLFVHLPMRIVITTRDVPTAIRGRHIPRGDHDECRGWVAWLRRQHFDPLVICSRFRSDSKCGRAGGHVVSTAYSCARPAAGVWDPVAGHSRRHAAEQRAVGALGG
jgi:hypothetical protein